MSTFPERERQGTDINHFSITYDLSQPGRDYPKLIAAIKELGIWVKPTESQWLVRTALTEMQVLGYLQTKIDPNDTLVVLGLSGSWAARARQAVLVALKKLLG